MRDMRSARWMTVALTTAVGLASILPIAAASADVAQPATSRLLIRVSASTTVVGNRVTATVVVVPRAAGRVVLLQRKHSDAWHNLVQATTNASGQAVLKLKLHSVGLYRLRASVVATALADAAISPVDSLDVVPVPPPYAGSSLAPGDSGAQVLALEQRLTELGYWLGSPGSYFGDATEQAVYAVQKAAGITPNGVVGSATVAALVAGVLPQPRSTSGQVIEVDLKHDLVLFVDNGQVSHVLNTSTGGGYTYVEQGATDVATTPSGVFHIYRAVDGLVIDSLGALWRPRFFTAGYAIHGDSYVPSVPVSHGCVRVSNEAIDWIWANNLAPVGTEVWVY